MRRRRRRWCREVEWATRGREEEEKEEDKRRGAATNLSVVEMARFILYSSRPEAGPSAQASPPPASEVILGLLCGVPPRPKIPILSPSVPFGPAKWPPSGMLARERVRAHLSTRLRLLKVSTRKGEASSSSPRRVMPIV